ncbi:MAG: PqqD family protein [Candidatus Dormibacteria bacterium]
MPDTQRFRLNAERVTAKIMDGEAIIIDVVTGRYHSLEGTGAPIWSLLSGGATVTEAAGSITDGYEVDAPTARHDVERILEELVAQELLVMDASAATPDPSPAPAPRPGDSAAPPPASGRLPYLAPALTTFTDMEDLLAFDPPLPAMDTQVWRAPPPLT